MEPPLKDLSGLKIGPKHHIVVLEECHCELPKFSFEHTYTGYDNTTASQVAERIRDATIVISTIVPVTPSDMNQAPQLKLLAIMATGIGWVDKDYCAKRGVTIVNCPQSNIPAVSEHCMALYFACRKKIVEMHTLTTQTNEWTEKGTLTKRWTGGPPLSCEQETIGIIGYGALGKKIESLATSMGFGTVLISERKREPVREGRKIFQIVLKDATVVVLCCPRDATTINLIGKEELRMMRKDACLINMARGGIVNEQALADALRYGWISAAATDVLDIEPAPLGSSPLLPKPGEEPVPNLTISPHVSWFSVKTVETLQKLLKEGVEGFVDGRPPEPNIIVHDGNIYR